MGEKYKKKTGAWKRVWDQRGFTLVELLATIVILGILIAIAVPAIGSLLDKASASADESSIALMEKAGENAYVDERIDFDGPEPESYTIPTLIEEGYLKLDDDHKFNQPENYVTKKNIGGEFIWMGDGNAGEPDTGGGVGTVDAAMSCPQAEAEGYICVYTDEEFNNIRNDLGAKYILMNDISLENYSPWQPIGNYDNETSQFHGVLNGNGMRITNLALGSGGGQSEVGLFGVMSHGEIKDVSLAAVTFDRGSDMRSRASAFLIGEAYSDDYYNPEKQPLTISNVALSGTAENADQFASLIGGSTEMANSLTIQDVYTDVEISNVDTATGLMMYYELMDDGVGSNTKITIEDVSINGSISGVDYAAGIMEEGYAYSGMPGDAFSVNNVEINADIISSGQASGLMTAMYAYAEGYEWSLRNVAINGSVTATGIDSANGLMSLVYLMEAKSSLVENIVVAGDVSSIGAATGFINGIFYNDSSSDENVMRNIDVRSDISGNQVSLFADQLEFSWHPGDVLIEDVQIEGTAKTDTSFATIANISSERGSGGVLDGFVVDVSVTQASGSSNDVSTFADNIYMYDNQTDTVLKNIDVTANIEANGSIYGFIRNITHENSDSSYVGHLSLDTIRVGGSLISTSGHVFGFVDAIGYDESLVQGPVDLLDISIDYKMRADQGTAYVPETTEDMRGYYYKYGTSNQLADSANSLITNISSVYDLSNHDGAVSATGAY